MQQLKVQISSYAAMSEIYFAFLKNWSELPPFTLNYVKLQLWQNGCNVKRPGLACSCVADFTVAGGGVHKSRGTWTHTDNARGVATN